MSLDKAQAVAHYRARLKKQKRRWLEISRMSNDFSYAWLVKFADGRMNNPTLETLQALDSCLSALEKAAEFHAKQSDQDA